MVVRSPFQRNYLQHGFFQLDRAKHLFLQKHSWFCEKEEYFLNSKIYCSYLSFIAISFQVFLKSTICKEFFEHFSAGASTVYASFDGILKTDQLHRFSF